MEGSLWNLWTFEEFPAERYVALRRTAIPFDDLEQLKRENETMIKRFTRGHADWGLLVDMRQAQARNDDGFEEAMRPLREASDAKFARVVVLIASAAGFLQIQRLRTTERTDTFTTRDEEEALRFARDGVKP